MPLFNPELMKLAAWRLEQQNKKNEKQAFVPGDPAAAAAGGGGGMPPMDPAMMAAAGGGAPPGGGMPPMDPAMMGGAGMPPAPPAPAQPAPAAPAAPGAAPAAGANGKPAKPDINTVAMDIYQVKKMLQHIFNLNQWALPPDIIDGPNRNPATGEAVAPNTPGSTSDPARAQQQPQGPQQQSAIPPIEAMQGAFPAAPGGGGGGEKQSASRIGEQYIDDLVNTGKPTPAKNLSKAAALSKLVHCLSDKSK